VEKLVLAHGFAIGAFQFLKNDGGTARADSWAQHGKP